MNISDRVLKDLKTELSHSFLSKVSISSPIMSLPGWAYNEERKQYDASKLIDFLHAELNCAGEKKIAICNIDLYASDLNFVFGVAQNGGGICIVSLHRLDPKLYGKGGDYEKMCGRVVKEAVHELGHCYGLDHCRNEKCVMSFSNDVVAVDRKGKFFCENCAEKLRACL